MSIRQTTCFIILVILCVPSTAFAGDILFPPFVFISVRLLLAYPLMIFIRYGCLRIGKLIKPFLWKDIDCLIRCHFKLILSVLSVSLVIDIIVFYPLNYFPSIGPYFICGSLISLAWVIDYQNKSYFKRNDINIEQHASSLLSLRIGLIFLIFILGFAFWEGYNAYDQWTKYLKDLAYTNEFCKDHPKVGYPREDGFFQPSKSQCYGHLDIHYPSLKPNRLYLVRFPWGKDLVYTPEGFELK